MLRAAEVSAGHDAHADTEHHTAALTADVVGQMPGCPVPDMCKMTAGAPCCGYGLAAGDWVRNPVWNTTTVIYAEQRLRFAGHSSFSLLRPPQA